MSTILVEVQFFYLLVFFLSRHITCWCSSEKKNVVPQWSKDYRLKTLYKTMPNCHPGHSHKTGVFFQHMRGSYIQVLLTQSVTECIAKTMVS